MMQFNTGKQFDELVENNLLNDVEAIAIEQKWKDKIPAPILAATTRNGKMFAVPVNIHGQNWLFYNTEVLKKLGATEPKTFDDLIAILDKVKAAGLIPLAFSGQKTWERGLFNAVMLGVGRPEALDGRSMATRIPRPLKIAGVQDRRRDFRQAAQLRRRRRGGPQLERRYRPRHPGQGRASRSWATGQRASSSPAGKTAGKEYGCTILAKAGGGYAMGGDVFAFPKTKDPAAAEGSRSCSPRCCSTR